jgi:3-deoxy-D-manno-octulosonate 8-phosphate phosphatase (KDO 8-P phosphatase)
MDGVLTDGTVLALESGEMARSLGSKDAFALQWATRRGYPVAVVSGGTALGMQARLTALGVSPVLMGVARKLPAVQELLHQWGFGWAQVAYIGDDMPDIPVLQLAGLAIAPADGSPDAQAAAHWVTPAPGGHGCVRQVVERWMKLQNTWYHPDVFHW